MRPTITYLQNYETVGKVFGYGLGFHDARVLGFNLATTAADQVEPLLHSCDMTDIVDKRGYFELCKHHLIRFVFRGVFDADLDHFTPDNILFALDFSTPEAFKADWQFKVTLDSATGADLCGSFHARSGAVTAVSPCDEKGHVREPGERKTPV